MVCGAASHVIVPLYFNAVVPVDWMNHNYPRKILLYFPVSVQPVFLVLQTPMIFEVSQWVYNA